MADEKQPLSNEELYTRAGKGDEAAFEKLVQLYQHALFGYFLRRTQKRGVAEELAQEVLIRLWKHAPTYRVRSKFRTYLYRVAHNMFVDYCRRQSARPNEYSLDSDEGSAVETFAENRTPSPEEELTAQEMKDRLHESLERLPEREREILLLVLEEGLPYRDVAEVLNIPEGTVKSRMHSAVGRLRRIMRTNRTP